MIFVLEGLDGCGKSTAAALVIDKLKKYIREKSTEGTEVASNPLYFSVEEQRVKHIVFPDRATFIGKLIDKALKDPNSKLPLDLLFAANKFERYEELADPNNLCIVERYSASACVYNNDEYVQRIHTEYLPPPTLTFFFDLSPEICYERCQKLERYETSLATFENVHKAYRSYFRLHQHVLLPIMESDLPETVADFIFRKIKDAMNCVEAVKRLKKTEEKPSISDVQKYKGKKVSMTLNINSETYYVQGTVTGIMSSLFVNDRGTSLSSPETEVFQYFVVLDGGIYIPIECITAIDGNYGIGMNPCETITRPRK